MIYINSKSITNIIKNIFFILNKTDIFDKFILIIVLLIIL